MGSVDAMQRVDATNRFAILLSINLSLFLSNMSMANGGRRHTESKRDQSSASPVLCTISCRMKIMFEVLVVIPVEQKKRNNVSYQKGEGS